MAVAAFVAAVVGVGDAVLSIGLIRVHPLLAVGLNIVAVGGLAPSLWGWRNTRCCAGLCWERGGCGRGVVGADRPRRIGQPLALAARTHPEQHVLPGRDGRLATAAAGRLFGRSGRGLLRRFGGLCLLGRLCGFVEGQVRDRCQWP
ncbi:hypothetical protein I551_0504 [Mycobacterium ulcerans str. Harvey]|uniref:Uncharacterized protein n=1 Tax=Mycobacterium ulcerans str. Harvey TaxID=1299332 RepID=A0ABP3ASQ6_MYCUL|nr:hypothetical protein I551_0504 [Mycobacterium ulcerans str. Harvey]